MNRIVIKKLIISMLILGVLTLSALLLSVSINKVVGNTHVAAEESTKTAEAIEAEWALRDLTQTSGIYNINNADDFYLFAYKIRQPDPDPSDQDPPPTIYRNKNFRLNNDIELDPVALNNKVENSNYRRPYTMVGIYDSAGTLAFSGTFNGLGHKITIKSLNPGTTATTQFPAIGLFTYIKNATISNLNIEYAFGDQKFKSSDDKTSVLDTTTCSFGLLCGVMESSTISNVIVTVSKLPQIQLQSTSFGGLVGSIIGSIKEGNNVVNNKITECAVVFNQGQVSVNVLKPTEHIGSAFGGLVGALSGYLYGYDPNNTPKVFHTVTITNCFFKGKVDGIPSDYRTYGPLYGVKCEEPVGPNATPPNEPQENSRVEYCATIDSKTTGQVAGKYDGNIYLAHVWYTSQDGSDLLGNQWMDCNDDYNNDSIHFWYWRPNVKIDDSAQPYPRQLLNLTSYDVRAVYAGDTDRWISAANRTITVKDDYGRDNNGTIGMYLPRGTITSDNIGDFALKENTEGLVEGRRQYSVKVFGFEIKIEIAPNYKYVNVSLNGDQIYYEFEDAMATVTLQDAVYLPDVNNANSAVEFNAAVLTAPSQDRSLLVDKGATIRVNDNVISFSYSGNDTNYTYTWQGSYANYFNIDWQYDDGSGGWNKLYNQNVGGELKIRPALTLKTFNLTLDTTKSGNVNVRTWYNGDNESSHQSIPNNKIENLAYNSTISCTMYDNLITITITPDVNLSNVLPVKLDRQTVHLHKNAILSGDLPGYEFTSLQLGSGGDFTSKFNLTDDETITALFKPIEYSLPLYYSTEKLEDDASTSITYKDYVNVTFTVENKTEFIKPEIVDGDLSFGAWIFNATNVDNSLFTVLYNQGGGTVTLTSKTSNSLSISFATNGRLNTILGGDFYVVTGIRVGSYGSLAAGETQNPLIYARWSKTYEVHIKNEDGGNLHYLDPDSVEENEYLGVFVNSNDEKLLSKENAYELKLLLKYNNDYAYNFVGSEMADGSLSFYTLQDYKNGVNYNYLSSSANGRWTVYNYGYRIVGWKIYFVYVNVTYYLTYNPSYGIGWQHIKEGEGIQENDKVIDVELLLNNNMAAMSWYAEHLDNILGFSNFTPKITMVPVWEAVNVSLKATLVNSLTQTSSVDISDKILYNTAYSLKNTNSFTAMGHELAYFKLPNADNKIVVVPERSANNVIWNYRTFSHNDFTYNADQKCYVLAGLTPKYSNNIYKINLFGADSYLLDENYSSYKFNSTSNGFGENVYNYKYSQFGYKLYSDYFPKDQQINFIDEYATWLISYINVYDNYVKSGVETEFEGNTLNILNKVVHYSNSSAKNDYELESVPINYYIYLANEFEIDGNNSLPVFKKDYYTLIYWENSVNTNNVYLTNALTSLNLDNPNETYDGKQALQIWRYEDGHGVNNLVDLNAHYFRKYYYLNAKTVLDENEMVGRYGYFVVSAKDIIDNSATNKSVNYLVIYDLDTNEMTYYTFANNFNIQTMSGLQPYNNKNLMIYFGCDLSFSVYDQSQDASAAASGNFDSFIGYRFKALTTSSFVTLNLNNDNFENYSSTLPATTIEEANIKNGNEGEVVVTFEKIVYSVNLVIDKNAGQLNLLHNGEELLNVSSITNMTVDEIYTITYYAQLGYELKEIAFSYTNNLDPNVIITLVNSTNEEGVLIQQYILTLNAEWLRTNYYANFDHDYNVQNTNLGNINANTQEIVFNFGIKVYDISDSGEYVNTRYLLETKNCATYTLTQNLVSLKPLFVKIGGGYGYKQGEAEYVVTQTAEYNVINPSNQLNGCVYFKNDYAYLLTAVPNDIDYKIDANTLRNMVIYSEGTIVPNDYRNIYFVAYVRRQYTITLTVDFAEHDPQSGVRTTTFSMQTRDNSDTLTISGISSKVSKQVYTYAGYTANRLNYSFNAIAQKRYSGVTYTLNGNNLQPNTNFAVDKDSEIIIQYIPKALNIITQFSVDGVVSSEQPQQVYSFRPSSSSSSLNLFIGDMLTVEYDYNLDYTINITFNGKEADEILDNSVKYTVKNDDYDSDAINILVTLVKHKNGDVEIKFLLEDGRASKSDNYGNFNVVIDRNGQQSSSKNIEKSVVLNVLEGSKITINVNLNKGYLFKNVKDDKNATITDSLTDNIVLTEQYDVAIRSYVIAIKKDNINVMLQFDDGQIANYTLDVDKEEGVEKSVDALGNVTLTGIYVGTEILIRRIDDLPYEALNFYYMEGYKDNHLSSPLLINSGLLEKANSNTITLKVDSTRKYLVTISYDNPELTNLVSPSDIAPEGKYIVEDEQINFSLNSTVPEKYVVSIYLQDDEDAIKESYETINFNLSGNKGNILIDGEIKAQVVELRFVNIRIAVAPRSFNQTSKVNEYLYSALNSAANKVEENTVNNAKNLGATKYLEQAQLSLTRLTDDRELTEFSITTVAGAKINVSLKDGLKASSDAGKVEISGNTLTLTIGEGDEAVTYNYTIIVQQNTIYIYYTIYGETELELYYTALKTIQPSE